MKRAQWGHAQEQLRRRVLGTWLCQAPFLSGWWRRIHHGHSQKAGRPCVPPEVGPRPAGGLGRDVRSGPGPEAPPDSRQPVTVAVATAPEAWAGRDPSVHHLLIRAVQWGDADSPASRRESRHLSGACARSCRAVGQEASQLPALSSLLGASVGAALRQGVGTSPRRPCSAGRLPPPSQFPDWKALPPSVN